MKKRLFPPVLAMVLVVACHAPQAVRAQTVSGQITVSETWSNVVFLTGDVTVMPSGNLTILPGTRVECDPRADDQASGIERTRIELIVNRGTFQAMGTEANPIVFTAGWASPTNPPQTGDWYGIRLNSTNASLRFCTVELAMEGLRFEGARPIVEYCTLRRNQRVGADAQGSARLSSCLITLNGGPGIAGGSSNSPMVIENCVVSSNVSSGIAGSFYVTNCTVRNNGDDGVFGPSPNPSVVVLSSVISSNAGYGILSSGRADMIDCVVTENARGGVTVFGGSANVTNCTISSNGGNGIYTTVGDASVANSSVRNNNGGGIIPERLATVQNSIVVQNSGYGIGAIDTLGITGNIIRENRIGIALISYAARVEGITGNDLFGNAQYDFQNNGTALIVADGNYWGEPTTTELRTNIRNLTKIFDVRDLSSVGQVVIHTWIDTPLHPLPPLIFVQPQSLLAWPGTNVIFSVVAIGTPSLSFQWQKDGSPILGATNDTLLLTNVVTTDAGNYTVTLSNSLGNVISDEARLSLDPRAKPELTLHMFAGLTLTGLSGQNYQIEYLTTLQETNNWLLLTNLNLPSSPYTFIDWGSTNSAKRFYRAVHLP